MSLNKPQNNISYIIESYKIHKILLNIERKLNAYWSQKKKLLVLSIQIHHIFILEPVSNL